MDAAGLELRACQLADDPFLHRSRRAGVAVVLDHQRDTALGDPTFALCGCRQWHRGERGAGEALGELMLSSDA